MITSAAGRDYVRDEVGKFADVPGVPHGPDLSNLEGVLDGPDLPVYNEDDYRGEFGDPLDEAGIEGMDLAVRVFDSGEGHISNDLPGDHFQPVSENLDAEAMREIGDDLSDLLEIDVGDLSAQDADADGVVYRTNTAGGLTVGRYASGDVRIERSADEFHMFDLSEDEASSLRDALDEMAGVWERQFEDGTNPDEVVVAALGVSRKGLKSDRALRRYWVRDPDHKIMWGVRGDFNRCVRHLRKYVRNPQGLCAEYHHEALGVWPGRGHKGHTSLQVPVKAAGGDDMHIVENSTGCGGRFAVVDSAGAIQGCYDTHQAALASMDGGPFRPPETTGAPLQGKPELWHAVVHIEGVSTGKRAWLPGSVSWRQPPFALHQEVASSAHGGQPVTVYIGNVTRMEKQGNMVHAWGDIDLGSAQGLEWARKLGAGFGGWPSFGPGSEKVIYDMIWGPKGPAAEPEQIVFRDYRVGEASAVSVPAQEGTFFEPLQALTDALSALSAGSITTAGAVASHGTATSDVAWDAGANEARLPSPLPVSTARKVYAWFDESRVQDGMLPKDAAKLPHHLVSADGRPGAADLAACSSAIGALHGARGHSAQIPQSDRQAVYNHLRKHLLDGGREPGDIPALSAAIVTAGGSWDLNIPLLPPAWWFDEPGEREFSAGYAVTMTDEGRIYGLLAPADIAHRTYARAGERKTLRDVGRVDYSRWIKETVVDGGGRVLAGPLVMECMHAPTRGYGSLDRRNQYYEDSCAIFARVAIGNRSSDGATWIAGAAMPGITTEQAIKFLSCDVSGDWQPHPERAGWTEFVAVLAVPVGGWPKSRTGVSVTRIQENADELVVAGAAVPTRFEPAAVPVDPAIIDSIAAGMGLDVESRIRATEREIAHLMGGTP